MKIKDIPFPVRVKIAKALLAGKDIDYFVVESLREQDKLRSGSTCDNEIRRDSNKCHNAATVCVGKTYLELDLNTSHNHLCRTCADLMLAGKEPDRGF